MAKKHRARNSADAARRCRSLYAFIRARLGAELSDREIARRWNMEWKSFAALKHGQRQVPRIDELERLAAVLAVTAGDVFVAASGVPQPAAPTSADEALRLSVDRVPHALFTVDVDGRIRDFNRALPRLTGLGERELRERPLIDLVAIDSTARALSWIAETTRHGRESAIELTLLATEPPARTVMLHATPLRDADGALVGAQAIARDLGAESSRADRPSPERRDSPRAPTAFLVKYRYRRRLREARVENVGQGGLFIQTDDRLARGARLELEWRQPGDNTRLQAVAVVAWSRPASSAAPAGIGLRFVEVAPAPFAV